MNPPSPSLPSWISALSDARKVLLPEERAQAVVFGSTALVLHGVDLGRFPTDLDLFLPPGSLAALLQRGALATETGGVVLLPGVEAFSHLPGLTWEEVEPGSRILPDSQGLKVASVAEVVRWKEAMGRRKDLADLEKVLVWKKGLAPSGSRSSSPWDTFLGAETALWKGGMDDEAE